MIEVTKDSFFATVGRMDVHPHIIGGYDCVRGYRSDWKLRHGDVLVGRSDGSPPFSKDAYMVTPEFFERRRNELIRVA